MTAKFILGLTGGIGSGKSAAAAAFAKLGVQVVDSDEAARVVVQSGQPALAQLVARYGADILAADGSLQRSALREIIFARPEERLWVEQLLHPLIRQHVDNQLAASTSAYAILMSPLLIESGRYKDVNSVLVVDVPEQLQRERVQRRDQLSQEQVSAIMQSQLAAEQRLAYADDVLVNNGSLQLLEQRVAALHEKYLFKAQEYDSKFNR